MRFSLILPASRVRLSTPAMGGDVEALRHDYGRASRLLLEVAITFGALAGASLLAVGAAAAQHGFAAALALAAIGAVVFAAGCGALVPFARSGSVLSRALARALQDRHGGSRERGLADAILARTHIVEGWMFWRIAAAALALLGAVMLLSIGIRALVQGETGLSCGLLAAGALLAVEGLAVAVAVTRINAAHSLRDPIQHRLLGRPGE